MAREHWESMKKLFNFAFGDSPAGPRRHAAPSAASPRNRGAGQSPRTPEQVGSATGEPPPRGSFSLALGELVTGRYRITRVIGCGGMGEVYEAQDEFLKEAIALKTLRVDLARDEGIVRRFQREIQLARKVTHPNICRVFETGRHESVRSDISEPFFTMELLIGETLSERIRREGRLSRAEAFPIAVQIAEGLQAAHEAGIVHADFKSGNVLLVPGTHGERAVITDFGLARIDPATVPADETRTTSAMGHVVGTVSVASDIYSLGIVLFEMATGKLPFEGRHVIKAAVQRVSGEGISARSLVPNLDSRWDAAIARCLQKEPERRFASAGDLADWFREGTWRMSPRYWTRREWIRIGAVTGIPVVAAGGYWVWFRKPYHAQPVALGWYQKGVAALHSMTYEAARRAFERAVEAEPGFALAHASLARAYEELDYSELANESMLRAMTAAQESRLSSEDARKLRALEFLVSHDYVRAKPLFQQFEDSASPGEKPAEALESGWLAEKGDDTKGAEAAYRRALKLNPGYAAAKLRLGFILGRRRQVPAALKAFQEAEDLYSASSDYEGVTETLLQKVNLLNRSSRSAEAMPLIQKALVASSTVGSPYKQIRLQLLQSVTARNLGDTKQAGALARQAIDAAITERMDNLATAGLMDLGNAFLKDGDLSSAEPIFRKALDVARRGKVRRLEARALASLASLCEQQHRPEEAKQFIDLATPFFRQAGYRREFIQAMAILGGVYQQEAKYDEGIQVLQETLASAIQLDDNKLTESLIRQRLGDCLRGQGAWPAALEQFELIQGSSAKFACTQLYWRLGRSQDAARRLSEVQQALKKSPDQTMLSKLRVLQAEMAYAKGHWAEALQALPPAGSGGEKAEPSADLIRALVTIRTRRSQGADLVNGEIQRLDQAGRQHEAAWARLSAAEAFVAVGNRGPALSLAAEALGFFEPRRIWEAVWRGHVVSALASQEAAEAEAHRTKARDALAQLKILWPSDMNNYLGRPDIKPLFDGIRI